MNDTILNYTSIDYMVGNKNLRELTVLPRQDLEENWVKNNPILKDKEFVISIDENIIGYKLGDGEHCYSDLTFVDLFKGIMLGRVYVPQPSFFGSIGLQLLNKELFEYIKDNDYNTIWDRQGNIIIKGAKQNENKINN